MRRRLTALLILFVAAFLSAQDSLNGPKLFGWGMNILTETNHRHTKLDAVEDFRASADLGYAPAQVMMGYLYETGTIVARDPGRAVEWYRKAAQQNDVLGEWLLGRSLYSGSGASKDLSEAGRWLQKAAEHNDPFGQYLLGMVRMESGDYAPAADLFRKASMQGLVQAQQQLASLLKQGQGVTADKMEAYVWLQVSADGGNKAVDAERQQLEAELGSSQTDIAKTKARELEKTVSRSVVAHGCTGWAGEFDAVPAPPPPETQRFCR
jgi:hypothetical protein